MYFDGVRRKLRSLETIFLICLALVLLLFVWLEREQSELSESVLRLHVLANSDSAVDQELKLKVRDRVLVEANELLKGETNIVEAQEILTKQLSRLAAIGAEVVAQEGFDYPVSAQLVETWFPTKEYRDFALPSGQYDALRIVIGEGEGQNWWCVVFPPLCLGSVSETTEEVAIEAGLSEKQISLMTGESEGYVVKFKALELWETIKGYFS